MKKNLPFIFSVLTAFAVNAQTGPNITSWHLNTTGQKASYKNSSNVTINMTDSAGIIKLCYDNTYVYLITDGLADDYVMGSWTNPNVPAAQNLVKRIPKTAQQQTSTKTSVPTGGVVALAVNGVPFFGNRSADSYKSSTNTNTSTGDGLWHSDAWYNEGATMDALGNGHNTSTGAYHYHANPISLYSTSSASHSPIVGFAYDGYPIYGPFGYSTATNSSSAIKRIKSSYQLRSITTRTTFSDGTTSSPAGPAVSGSFPLGMYVEDYYYVSNSGDLDQYNGRFCYTPEYPTGTYAYFITTDDSGNPAFPYIFATQYYGIVPSGNITSIPTSGVTCVTSVTGIVENNIAEENISVYPNPASDNVIVEVKGSNGFEVTINNYMGQAVGSRKMDASKGSFSLEGMEPGLYLLMIRNEEGKTQSMTIVKE
jgi:hypothetical protein